MILISNLYATHGLMLLFALAAIVLSIPESRGKVMAVWRVPVAAALAALSALLLIAYPTWGELKNPGLWAFAIGAAVLGAARGYWMQLDVDHGNNLIRLTKALDGILVAVMLLLMVSIEIGVATVAPADQPTMELGLSVLGFFLVGRAAAVVWRARNEPQTDLLDRPPPPVEE